MPTVLLTGFEPFGGAESNSSGEAVTLLASQWSSPVHLVTAVLPVEFGAAAETLLSLARRHEADAVIATGLAEHRTAITPERVAVNLADARIPDNAGARPIDERVLDDAPDAYFSALPVRAIVDRVSSAGIPAELSLSAGSYVCNDVMFRLRHGFAGPSGFIHVPPATVIDVPTIVRALRIAVETTVDVGAG